MSTFDLIRNTVGTALPAAGLARSGTLRRETVGALDANNDPTAPVVTTHSFSGFRDEFSASDKTRAQIPEDHFKINIYGSTIDVEPRRDDQILLQGSWSRVIRVFEIDPANALYVLECHSIRAPTP